MAQFFKAKAKSATPTGKLTLEAKSLDHLGAGVAQHQGKVVFVPGLLPAEQAQVRLTEDKKQFARGQIIQLLRSSTVRVAPACPHYGSCGGCDLQHLQLAAQRQHKRQVLTELFAKFSGISALPEIDTLASEPWHYRRKARLATWYDRANNRFYLGFRARESDRVIPLGECPVLAPALSALIKPLAATLAQLQGVASLGHVELLDTESGVMVLLRITQALSDKDRQRLSALAEKLSCQLVLHDGEAQYDYLRGDAPFYELQLADKTVQLQFSPANFIQINAQVNQLMVAKAIEWLAPKPGEKILDLFCGMGNFSLPLAAYGAEVVGIEGVAQLVQQARNNAAAATVNAVFYEADLSADVSAAPWLRPVDKLLLDPSRAGAWELLEQLPVMAPSHVVYVSCNPANLARDSVRLQQQGYQLQRLALLDMFPQTHHIEAMALFMRK